MSKPILQADKPADFRKLPVAIKAVQWDGSLLIGSAIQDWSGEKVRYHDPKYSYPCLIVETDEGTMTAYKTDWIIRGVKGEFYPCKDAVFQATYEEACHMSLRDIKEPVVKGPDGKFRWSVQGPPHDIYASARLEWDTLVFEEQRHGAEAKKAQVLKAVNEEVIL